MKHTKVKNIKFEDGEWWYFGQADGRRRVNAHVKKNEKRMKHLVGLIKTMKKQTKQCPQDIKNI